MTLGQSLRPARYEAFAGSLHDGFGHFLQRIDFKDSLHLREQPVQ